MGSIRGVKIELSADASSAKKELDNLSKTTKSVTDNLNVLKKGLKITGDAGSLAKAMDLSKRKIEDAKKALKEYETYYNGILNREELNETQLIGLEEKMEKYKNSIKFAEQEFKNISKMKLEFDTKQFESDINDSTTKVEKLEKEIEALNDTSGKFNKDNYSQQMKKREQIVEELTRQQKLYNEQLDRMKSNGIDEQSAEYQELEKSIAECTIAAKKMNDEIKQNSTLRLDNVANGLDDWGKKFESAGKTLTTYVSAPLAAATIGSAKAAMNFEDTFAGVQKTVNDASTEQLNKIKEDIIKMSTVGINGHNAIPILATDLNELAAAGGQLGIEADNISEFTEVTAMLGTATNLVGAEGASTLAKFANVTQMSQKDFDRLGSSIVALGNNFATTEQDIANMAQNIAGAGAQMGLSEADILGISTALSSVGIEAQAGGTAFSKVLIAMKSASTLGFDQINSVIDKTGISLRDLQLMSANDSKSFKELANSLGYTKDELNSMIKSGVQLQNFGEITGKTGEEFKKMVDSNPAEAVDAFISGLQNADNVGESAIEMLQDMGFTEERLRRALLNLASSEDGVTKAVNMSNEAWSENVALLNEFTTKSETTASKLQVAKQNIIEAGRSLGELFLPYIASGSEKVSELAQWLAALDDDTKGAIITIGGFAAAAGVALITLGKLNQGVSVLIKTWSKFKKAQTLGGGLLSLTKLNAPTAIITGIIAALALGIKLYKDYQEAQINWSEGLYEAAEKVQTGYDKVKKLGDLQKEIGNLKLVINSDDSSDEEVEKAKTRIKEITDLLNEEYNLDISTDDSSLDNTIEKLDDVISKQKEIDLNSARGASADLGVKLSSDVEKYEENSTKIQENQRLFDDASKKATKYKNAIEQLNNISNNFQNTMNDYREKHNTSMDYGDPEQFSKIRTESLEKVNNILKGIGYDGAVSEMGLLLGVISNLSQEAEDAADSATEYEDALNGLKASQEEFEKSRDEYVKGGLTEITHGNEKKGIEQLTTAVKEYHAEALETSLAATKAKSGISDFSELAAQGGEAIGKAVTNYQNMAKEIGASGSEIAIGSALIQNGFDSIGEAADAGKLDLIIQQANDLAHELKLIPEDKTITIDADGNISVISETEKLLRSLEGEKIIVEIGADNTPAKVTIGDTTLAVKDYNKETGIATLYTDNGKAIATINFTTGQITGIPDGNCVINVNNSDALAKIAEVERKIVTLKNGSTVDLNIVQRFSTIGTPVDKNNFETFTAGGILNKNGKKAEGTSNFPGGRALVNDENTYDPREIIKEPGKAPYIPQGRNILLDLPPGTQIIRARDTKKILRNIPHFANGNTAFSQAKDSWSHYKNTHTVTTMQDFAWWSDALTKYRADAEAVKEIDEQLFKLKQDLKKDELEELEFWLDMSWITEEEYYNRLAKFRDENYAKWDKDYKELTLKIHDYNQECFSNWVSDQETALERIENREGIYYDKRLELYQKIKDEAQRQYDEGIITHQTYLDTITDMEDKALEARMAAADKRHNNSMAWIENMDFYDGWGGQNGTKMEALYRVKDNLDKDLANGDITWEEYLEKQSEVNKDIYTEFMDTIDSMDEGMQEAHEKRLDLIDESYDKELESLEKYKDRQIDAVNEVYDAKIEAINKEIEAIQELREIEDEQEQIDNAKKSLSAAQALYLYSRDDDERAELLNEVIRKQNELDDLLDEQSDNQRIRELEAKAEALEDERDARLAQVEADYNAAISKSRHSYNSQIKKAEASYMQSQKSLADAINSNTTVWSNLVNNFSGNNSTVNTVNKGNNTINFSSVNAPTTGQIRMLIQSIVGDF